MRNRGASWWALLLAVLLVSGSVGLAGCDLIAGSDEDAEEAERSDDRDSESDDDAKPDPNADADGVHVGGLWLTVGVSQSKVLETLGTEDERYGSEGEVNYIWNFEDGNRLTVAFDEVGAILRATLVCEEGARLDDDSYVMFDGRRLRLGQDTLQDAQEWFPNGQLGDVISGEGSSFLDYAVGYGPEGTYEISFSVLWEWDSEGVENSQAEQLPITAVTAGLPYNW